jgi:hypothetical protein
VFFESRTSEERAMASAKVAALPADINLRSLKKYTRDAVDGECDLILEFNGEVNPKKIVKYVDWAGKEYRLKIVVQHAELRDYVELSCAGAGIGLGVGLLAYALGFVSWPAVLAATGIGALLGLLTTSVNMRIYKYRGNTRVKIET